MSAPFQINFRREVFRRERGEARHRAVGLGVWLAYFGTLAVLIGLYVLNYRELDARSRQLQHQIEHQRVVNRAGETWVATPSEAAAAEPWVSDAARWRDLLGRLPGLLPAAARLTSLQFNPDQVSGGERKLLLSGTLRLDAGRDRVAGVTDIVASIANDSLFAARFHSVRLVSTRTREGSPDAEFQLECK